MDKITAFAIQNSRFTWLIILMIFVMGVISFLEMPRLEDPKIVIRTAQVNASFPGLSVKLTEELVAKPIEREVKRMAEIDSLESIVTAGQLVLKVNIQEKYVDLDPIWQDLRDKMSDVKPKLPEGTQGPFVNDDYGDVASVVFALSGDAYSMAELTEFANDVKDKMSALSSVTKVDLFGVQQERVYISFNPSLMANLGITGNQLVNTIRQQNVIFPGGSINTDGTEITIDPSGNFLSIDDLKRLEIDVADGQSVYLQDIANVWRGYVDPPVRPSYFNGKPAIMISASMIDNYNIMEFGEEVKVFHENIQNTLPVGADLDIAIYQPQYVDASVKSATSSLYQTIAVVLTVVMIFLGYRTGLIIGAIVPLTILLTVIVMVLSGIELHRMSIAAIIISLGLLVDNGIVIAEDMKSRLDDGVERLQASLGAVKSLALPLLSSSLTTILAFMPLILVQNTTGEFLRALGQVVMIALLSSWLLAVFVTPALCYWFLKNKDSSTVENKETYSEAYYGYYKKFLHFVLRQKTLFLSLVIGLFALSIWGMGFVGNQLMPPSTRTQFLVDIDLPAGVHVTETQKVIQRLLSWLDDEIENPDVKNSIAYIGFGGPRFFLALNPSDPAPNMSFVVVNTKTPESVNGLVEKVNAFMLQEMPEASGNAKLMSLSQDEVGTVIYRISGADDQELWKISNIYANSLKRVEGVLGVKNNWQNPTVRLKVDLDQQRVRRSGVSSLTVAQSLGAYFDGYVVSDYREGDKTIPILFRGDEERNNLAKVMDLPVVSSSGAAVTLSQVANFNGSIEPSRIVRYNQERTMSVEGRVPGVTAAALHQMVMDDLKSQGYELPDGYSVELGGEIEGSEKANGALFEYMPLALALIVVLLVLQFNSFRKPAIIFTTIPLVLIGACLGLLLTNTMMDFNGMLGMFSLAGIIVNNGIVLIDRIEVELEEAKSQYDAIVSACIARLRPIVMTTLTTILGLMPMLLFGEELWRAMSVIIVFGLAVGSILTLGVVPVLYASFYRDNK